jgi:hypothetical protein
MMRCRRWWIGQAVASALSLVSETHVQMTVQGAGLPHALQRVFAPAQGNSRWHVSPGIDVLGYAFGWVFIALPAVFLLDAPGYSRLLVYFAVGSLIDTHRHYTFSYLYLDREVRRRYPVRFLLLPALCLALWTRTPALAQSTEMIGASEAGAIVLWLWLTIHLAWQDQGGPFQWRTAMPLFLGGLAVASAASTALGATLGIGWTWLGAGLTVSLLLHLCVSRDDARVPGSAARTHWVFPAVALSIAGLTGLEVLRAAQFPLRFPTSLLVLTFLTWQTYHVVMQKYGILRVYSAKSGCSKKVPAWVDRLLLLSAFPPFLVWTGHSEMYALTAGLANANEDMANLILSPLSLLGRHFGVLMKLTGAFWAAAVAIFLVHEWRVHRFGNGPRLWYATGTTLLYLAVFQLGLEKAYLVFASSHGLEYIVFIWGYQRRRYRDEAARRDASPILLRHPVALYVTLTVLVLGAIFYANHTDEFPALASVPRMIFHVDVGEWLLWFTFYHGVLHFYFDGFLWKLRRPAMLAHI